METDGYLPTYMCNLSLHLEGGITGVKLKEQKKNDKNKAQLPSSSSAPKQTI
jgi:hypothetical protein